MIERYTRPRMGAVWSEEEKLKIWLEVEVLALRPCREGRSATDGAGTYPRDGPRQC
jgi:adenylosuccinate lyase